MPQVCASDLPLYFMRFWMGLFTKQWFDDFEQSGAGGMRQW